MAEEQEIKRSARFMLFFQAEGLCQSLRLVVQTGGKPGSAVAALMNKMIASAKQTSHGDPIDRLPDVSEGMGAADLLVIAEILRSTMLAFLTPEEVEAQRRSIGFHQAD
jgi:hypothetical protein